MNIVWVGCEAINLDLVKRFRVVPKDRDGGESRGAVAGPGSTLRVELVFTDSSTTAFEGADAEAFCCYLRRNSSSLDAEGGLGEFAADCDGPLPAHAHGAEQGA